MKKKLLAKIKEIYDNEENIIKYLKNIDERERNSFEDIMISYDFQAGTYVENYYKHQNDSLWKRYYDEIAKVIGKYLDILENVVLLEAGCGEATTLASVYTKINREKIKSIYGLDASFSRLMVAKKFVRERMDVNWIMGDMMQMPICDDACDLVFTVHACEPNGGNEETLIKELLRVTNKYLLLFEPAYDFAEAEARRRMNQHGYVTRLYDVICEMKCNVLEHHLLGVSLNDLNPTGVTVIEKTGGYKSKNNMVLAEPINKKPVVQLDDALWSKESMLLFPRINDINCMCEDNAIIATKYEAFL